MFGDEKVVHIVFFSFLVLYFLRIAAHCSQKQYYAKEPLFKTKQWAEKC